MSYFISIKTAIVVCPLIAFLFSIPFVLHQYHKYGSIYPFRVLIVYSFIFYLITIYFLVILPLPNKEEVIYKPNMIKLIPFGFINDFIRESSFVINDPTTYLKAIKEPCFYTVIYNIFMTIPFGMYLRYYFKCNFKKTLFISFILSLFFELTQASGLYGLYPYPYRVFDVDDLIMNTLGGIIGYFIMRFVDNFLPPREKIDEDSLEAGEVVSGFRRITMFSLDCFLYIFIFTFISLFISNKYIPLIVFAIYFIIYPYFKNGQTFGSKFLNVRLEFKKYRFIKITLRIIFLFLYYFGSIFITFTLIFFIANNFNLNATQKFLLLIMAFLGILIFYLINIFALFKDKKIYYDNFFKVKYVSTIKNEGDDTENNIISG